MRQQFLKNGLPKLELGINSFPGECSSISLEGLIFLSTKLISSYPAATGFRKNPVFTLIFWGIFV